jgi:hypothetical protein
VTTETYREFDRYVRGFFVGLSGILFLTALACVFLFQKHAHAKAGFVEIAGLTKSESSMSEDVVTPHTRTGMIQNGSWDVLTSTKSRVHNQNLNDFSAKDSFERTETVEESTPSPTLSSTPERRRVSHRVNRMNQSNSVRTFKRKAPYPNHRSVRQLTDAQIRRRLLQLWHRGEAGNNSEP